MNCRGEEYAALAGPLTIASSGIADISVAFAPVVLPERRHPAAAAFGCGHGPRDAAAACYGEAAEVYCSAFRAECDTTRATLAGLPGAIDPRSLLLVSDEQYENRRSLNAVLPERHRIPERYDERRAIDWVRGTDLLTGAPAWVPATCCWVGYPCGPGEASFATADSSGCGSGASLADATLHGVLECVERDATALWWYSRAHRPAVDLGTMNEPSFLAVREGLRARGRSLVVIDVTTDIEIPSYVAITTGPGGDTPVFGAASHPIPAVACWKAVAEAVLTWVCAGVCSLPADISAWVRTTLTSDHAFLQGHGTAVVPAAPVERAADAWLTWCLTHLRVLGLHPVRVDLTRADLFVPVVRVFVPGLRPVLDRRAPGRLYSVPGKLGWRGSADGRLNPVPCTW
jgi:thiazole/oxazole-forming peptide maturase SagD family component